MSNYLAQFPRFGTIYRFKQKLRCLLLKKSGTGRQCQPLACRFLRAVREIRQSGFPQLGTFAERSTPARNEIAAIWRFSRNKGMK